MEFEFDKEMDALLRQTARSETASLAGSRKSPHLDADEISAFAENALPEKTKLQYTAHFADCDRCRKILSNTILLNAEVLEKMVHAPETVKVELAVLPWYRRLFAVPNLAYTMGALVLVFGGLIAFTFLKSVSRDAVEVSQMSESPMTAMNTNSAGEMPAQTQSNAAAMTNSASMQSNMAATNSATDSVSNSLASNASTKNAAVSPTSNAATLNKQTAAETETSKNELPSVVDSFAPAAPPPPPPAKSVMPENQMSSGDTDSARSNNAARNTQPTVTEEKQARKEDSEADKGAAASSSPKPVSDKQSTALNSRSANDAREKKSQKKDAVKDEVRAVGGKKFRRENNVWYDAAYSGQNTTNIARGSEDFKRLDAGLRSIAASFGGTIVVVWKGKAYRIQ
ncbi:MAG TPA: hypothetical protein VNI84_17645 [Pyrinomonadaceae bacterium]|nr:hypothetical protein [Pyrinomonadaceae bacterium]